MTIEIDTIKGFGDYLPPDSLKRAKMKQIIEKNFRLFGFLPIETPLLEYDELMKSGNDEDEAVSDRYKLVDKGGRNLGLRYEFTFQLARILKQNPNLKLPFRRYQIGENFRDEPIRSGRTRQFTQCDVDVIGDSSPNAEMDCIAAVGSALREMNIETTILINNRKLLNAIIESVSAEANQQILRELDKLEKVGQDQVKIALKKYMSTNQVITLFKLLEKDLKFFRENAFAGADELEDLLDLCKQYGVSALFVPTMVRGFAYYTGNIFEAVIDGTKTAIAGGGRYDKTVGKYLWKDIPAVGFSFSLEALLGLCGEQLNSIDIDMTPRAAIISISQDFESIKLAKKLRKEGISCIIEFEKIGKALEYADAWQIPFVIFVGEEEVGKKKYKLKEMKKGVESLLSEAQLIKKLK